MLKKIKNQENIIIIFFVVTLVGVGLYAYFGHAVVDVIYFVIMLFYFGRFLMIKNKGK